MSSAQPFTTLRAFGFSVFPLRTRSKEPAGKWKRYQSTIASEQKCQEWDHGGYNVAIATGKVSRCFVLDIDGEKGQQTLAQLLEKHGALPDTATVQTKRGLHYYFAYPDAPGIVIRNLASKTGAGDDLPGIDVRGDGGYAAAPPSIHESGTVYTWLRSPWDAGLADAPEWLISLVNVAKEAAALDYNQADDLPPAYFDKAIDGELSRLRAANEGSRNHALNKAAFRLGQLINRGLGEQRITNDLSNAARSIGLDEQEIIATIRSGIDAGKASPRAEGGQMSGINTVDGEIHISPLIHAKSDDILYALDVIAAFGANNLVSALTNFWHWNGNGVWQRLDDWQIKKVIHRIASGSERLTKNVIASILDIVKSETSILDSTFDKPADLAINCQNGELHLHGGQWQFRPADRKSYYTVQLPVAYDVSAQAPRFRQFLAEIFAHDHDAQQKSQVLLEMMGYSLLRSCIFEKFVILIGSGANGKSVLLKVLTGLLGYRNVSAVCPSQFDNRFQRAHLHGKLANIVSELSEGGEIADATLKAIVSGEVITAEHKHKPPFEFRPYCTCWFGTNHMPQTRDFSDAIYRRAIILTFNRKFEGTACDPHLAETLLGELPGIFIMMLDAIADVITRKAFTDPASSIDAKQHWRMESDQVAQFLEDCCSLHKDHETSSQEIYAHYQQWAKEAGSLRPLNRKNFTNRLKRFGVEPHKGTGGRRMLYGIRLISAFEGDEA